MALTPEQERLLDSCPVLSQMKEFFAFESSSSNDSGSSGNDDSGSSSNDDTGNDDSGSDDTSNSTEGN